MRASTLNLAKVTVLGAAGGIGQPLSLLLKSNPLVSELRCYDVRGAPGVAADLSHICSPAKVTGFAKDDLARSLDGCDMVLIPAGVPRKPGMTRDDLFTTNASIVRDLTVAVAKTAPKALIGIICNPVNSTVPIAAETLKKAGVYDPNRLFGVTTLDIVRARTFVAEATGKSPFEVNVPVIGGHSGQTIVPLFSQSGVKLGEDQVAALTHRVQFGGDEVVAAKDGAGSATLSMAFAASEWSTAVLKGLRGDGGIVECCFVESSIQPRVPYFASPVEFGKDGVAKIHPVGPLNKHEEGLLEKCLSELEANIKKGTDFGRQ